MKRFQSALLALCFTYVLMPSISSGASAPTECARPDWTDQFTVSRNRLLLGDDFFIVVGGVGVAAIRTPIFKRSRMEVWKDDQRSIIAVPYLVSHDLVMNKYRIEDCEGESLGFVEVVFNAESTAVDYVVLKNPDDHFIARTPGRASSTKGLRFSSSGTRMITVSPPHREGYGVNTEDWDIITDGSADPRLIAYALLVLRQTERSGALRIRKEAATRP